MSRVVVVGAGLTGLAAALHLRRAGVEPIVLEREADPGGACRTLAAGEFRFDLTGHLLHLARPESAALVEELGLARQFRRHVRRAGVALAGAVTPYPIQIHTHRLPPAIRRDCLLGYVEALAQGEPGGEDFASWVLSRFGGGLARHFFFPYNRKLFRTEPEDLTTEWVGRFVPRPSPAEVVDGALGLHRGPVGYNASFLYPRRGGIRLLPDALAARVDGVRLATPVASVDLDRRAVVLRDGARVRWDTLIWTGSLAALAGCARGLPAPLRTAALRLRAVAVWNLNLGVEGPPPRREHWLYVPEEEHPFYRVGIPSNHGRLAPPGCHTLSVEVSLASGSAPPADLEERCMASLGRLGLLREGARVLERRMAVIDPGYVVYDRARSAAVATLREGLLGRGVRLAGRWAEWKYSAMEDALLDGAAVARSLT